MWPMSWLHQGLLFAHLVAFAVAVSAVLREDLRLCAGRAVFPSSLAATARIVGWALAALWASGLAMIGCEYLRDPAVFAVGPKLAAKLLVVVALTANGLALHTLVFPLLGRGSRPVRGDIGWLPLLLGAVSTTSWFYASFVGASRLVAARMTLRDFVLLYAASLVTGALVAVLVVRPRLLRETSNQRGRDRRSSPGSIRPSTSSLRIR